MKKLQKRNNTLHIFTTIFLVFRLSVIRISCVWTYLRWIMKSQHVVQIECDVLGKIIGREWRGEEGVTEKGDYKKERVNTENFQQQKMSLWLTYNGWHFWTFPYFIFSWKSLSLQLWKEQIFEFNFAFITNPFLLVIFLSIKGWYLARWGNSTYSNILLNIIAWVLDACTRVGISFDIEFFSFRES